MADNRAPRLCFLMQRAYPLFNPACRAGFGGAEVNLYHQATWFAGQGCEVIFLTGDFGQADEETREGVCVRRIRRLDLERYRSPWDKARRLASLFRGIAKADADLYVMRAAGENLGWLVLLAQRLMGRKVVFQLAHEMDLRPAACPGLSRKSRLLYGYGLSRCDLVIAQSAEQQAQLRAITGLDAVVVRNSFRMGPEDADIAKTTVLWVARAEEWKRPRLFLEMARRLPGLPFVMILSGTGALADAVGEEARDIPNLTFAGPVPFGEVDRYFRDARVFVNTSVREGFPNTFIQAFLCGTPVLSLRVDPDGILTRGGLGWCCGDDLDAAVRILGALSQQELEARGRACRAYARQNHGIEQNGPVYRRHYEALLRREPGG